MEKHHWLVKQEPTDYSWNTLEKEGTTAWTGVRNYQARNNLRAMNKGDLVIFYHSGENKEAVGIAKVAREAYPDPTATEGDWSAVDLVPVKSLAEPVTLSSIKGDPVLQSMPIVRHSRLSVMPLTAVHFARLLELGRTQIKANQGTG
jgi:predicted RNA-binding protein with PUA-like domain